MGLSAPKGCQEVLRCEKYAPQAYVLYVKRADDEADGGFQYQKAVKKSSDARNTHRRRMCYTSSVRTTKQMWLIDSLLSEAKWNRDRSLSPSHQQHGAGVFVLFPRKEAEMFKKLKEEIASIKARDPAVRSAWEVYFLYPSFKAIRAYRRAHWFHEHGHYFIARWISQNARNRTGIEIHPGAKIGKGLFIDHGAGVVIGETTEIGDNCTLYQNVTLGGTGKDVGKRHPTLGNNVMVGAGARVLGPFKIGDNSKIAANAVVLEEVPPNCTAVGVPARVVKRDGIKVGITPNSDLDQIHIPDPVSQLLCEHLVHIEALEKQVNELKTEIKTLKEEK